MPIIPKIINVVFVRLLFSCQIGMGAKFGRGVSLGYGGLGVVIHHRAIIGNNVNIGTGVTIGGTSGNYEVPIIGKNCIISTGVKILGGVNVGDGCVIGANSVVITDIEEKSLVVGIPGKIKKRNIIISEYLN